MVGKYNDLTYYLIFIIGEKNASIVKNKQTVYFIIRMAQK
jgi:hypothetical protein